MKAIAARVAVAAALAPVAWAAAAASCPAAAADAGASGGAALEDDGAAAAAAAARRAAALAGDAPAALLLGVELLQTQAAMPREENGTAPRAGLAALAHPKEAPPVVKSRALVPKGHFLERVTRRARRCHFRGNLTAALARQRQIPFVSDIVEGVNDAVGSVAGAVGRVAGAVGDAVESAAGAVESAAGTVYNATFITVALAINATLNVVQEKAVDLLVTCQDFRDSLLEATRKASGSAWDTLSSSLTGWIDSFMAIWVPALESLDLAVPIIAETLAAFGYESAAVPFNKTMTSVLQVADQITVQLANTSAVVAQVAGAENESTALLNSALGEIESFTNTAVAEATEFGTELQDALMGLILDLARRITGVDITEAEVSRASPGSVAAMIAGLGREVNNITDTFTTALGSAFTGINEAAALATVQDSGGAPAAAPPAWLLALLCAFVATAAALPTQPAA